MSFSTYGIATWRALSENSSLNALISFSAVQLWYLWKFQGNPFWICRVCSKSNYSYYVGKSACMTSDQHLNRLLIHDGTDSFDILCTHVDYWKVPRFICKETTTDECRLFELRFSLESQKLVRNLPFLLQEHNNILISFHFKLQNVVPFQGP